MYCVKCGAEINDEAVICPKCGCYTNQVKTKKQNNTAQPTTLQTIAKVFMILGCIFNAFWIISLVWTIPMTTSYTSKINSGESVGVGFKICSLLFVNLIAGILMLCDNN